MTVTSFRQFQRVVKNFGDSIPDLHSQIMRKVSLDVLRGLTNVSPVDQGTFRANWMTAIGAPSLLVTADTDNNAVARGAAVLASLPPFSVVYLTNNLPYARRLEDGYSQKAPAGVVQVSVANVASVFQ